MRTRVFAGAGGALVVLMALQPAGAGAQVLANYDYENLTFRGIGVDWGHIWPDKVDATSLWSLRVDLGYIGPAVRIMPSVSWWSSELKESELVNVAERLSNLPTLVERGVTIDASDLGTVEWTNITLGLDAHLVWTAPLHIFTYVGIGVGLHAMDGSGESIDDTFIEDLLDTMTAGGAVMAGLEYEPTPLLRLFGEARYVLQSEVRYPALRFGAALMVPSRTGRTQ
jgi:hypothetical protein